jgi:hypothetical protein
MGIATDVVKHSLLRTLSVICTLLVIGGLGWSIYVSFVRPITKPNPSTTQNAEKIENTYIYPNKRVFFLGITLWGLDIGIVKNAVEREPKVKSNVKTPVNPS